MDKTCATCIENDDGLCDRKGILVHDDDTCSQHKESWKDAMLRQFNRRTMRYWPPSLVMKGSWKKTERSQPPAGARVCRASWKDGKRFIHRRVEATEKRTESYIYGTSKAALWAKAEATGTKSLAVLWGTFKQRYELSCQCWRLRQYHALYLVAEHWNRSTGHIGNTCRRCQHSEST